MIGSALILNDRGTPEPPTEMQRRLGQIHPSLHLRYVPDGWAVAERWREDDPRRGMIRCGDMNPGDDWDMLAQLPHDCSPNEAYGFIVNALRRSSKESMRDLLDRVHHWNDEQTKRNAAPTVEYAEELADHSKYTMAESLGLSPVRPVYQSEPKAATKGRKRRKAKEL
jgi:hypothetical protein